jgi:PKHD-type hydroxylase
MHHTLRKNPDLAGIASEILIFTSDECETIISMALQEDNPDSQSLVENDSICSLTQYSIDRKRFSGLYQHINKVFSVGNFLNFYYTDISLKIIRYRDGGFHAPHTDWSADKLRRKLSMVVQLSEADDYTGSEAIIHAGPDGISITQERGVGAVWPSWTLHEATPVRSGERWELVAYAEGSPFS